MDSLFPELHNLIIDTLEFKYRTALLFINKYWNSLINLTIIHISDLNIFEKLAKNEDYISIANFFKRSPIKDEISIKYNEKRLSQIIPMCITKKIPLSIMPFLIDTATLDISTISRLAEILRHYGFKKSNSDFIKLGLKLGFKISYKAGDKRLLQYYDLKTMMRYACKKGIIENVYYVHNINCDIDLPLEDAIYGMNIDIINISLLQYNYEELDKHITDCMHMMCHKGNYKAAKWILDTIPSHMYD